MSPEQIYQVALGAGFPPATAIKMVAIALKESSGDPRAHNAVPPDDSYGLWQINMLGALGVARLKEFGLASKEDLYSPAVNARVAFSLWGGSDANLDRHWAIERSALNRARYQSYLPTAQAAAERVELARGASPEAPDALHVPGGLLVPAGPSRPPQAGKTASGAAARKKAGRKRPLRPRRV